MDQLVDGRYIAQVDAHPLILFLELSDFLGDDINNRRQMLEHRPVHVRRIDGSTVLINSKQVTIMG